MFHIIDNDNCSVNVDVGVEKIESYHSPKLAVTTQSVNPVKIFKANRIRAVRTYLNFCLTSLLLEIIKSYVMIGSSVGFFTWHKGSKE